MKHTQHLVTITAQDSEEITTTYAEVRVVEDRDLAIAGTILAWHNHSRAEPNRWTIVRVEVKERPPDTP